MRNSRAYFDYNASAPLRPEAREAMLAVLELPGNASSVHVEGRRLRAIVEDAREEVAVLLGAKPAEVVFTSGATEANNWVLGGGWTSVIVSGIEHESILAPASMGAGEVIEIPVDGRGVVLISALDGLLDAIAGPRQAVLLSLQLANNETGVVQPVSQAVEAGHARGFKVHSDATQAVGRMGINFAALGLDFLSMSGHKIGGPKGVGALVLRDGVQLSTLFKGGGQERRRRAGTENVAAIAGLGAAATAARSDLGRISELAGMRDRLEAGVRQITPEAVIIGGTVPRLCNTSCIALPGQNANALVVKLDLAGMAVGAGSACSSGKMGGSHVMQAMGIDREIGEGAIRVSLGAETREADIDAFLAAWVDIKRGAHTWQRDETAVPGAGTVRLRAGE